MSTSSPAFRDRILAIHGQIGRDWLRTLTDLQDKMALRWSLSDIHPIKDLSYNYLAFATTTDNAPVVLKLGVPHSELEYEILALSVYNGRGVVRLLVSDPSLGALLLERILPGENLLTIQDDQESTQIAAQVMKEVWKPVPPDIQFPTVASWCQGFQRYLDRSPENKPLPAVMIRDAANLAKELLADSHNLLLLHGDLHHMNILLGENEKWIAIDPKGVIGEAAFEVGALMLNPIPELIHRSNIINIQKQRLKILEESLSIDKKRLASWSFVRAALSAIWSLEDSEDWRYGIQMAEVLRDLI